jgi:hypothetical protein
MKYIAIRLAVSLITFFVGLSSVAVLSPFRSATVSSGEAQQEILRAEYPYVQAHLNNNTVALDGLLADEFTIRSRRGRVTNKAQRLALLDSPDFAIEAFKTDNVQVEVNGNSAIVTGDAFIRSRYGDEEFVSTSYRFARNYEKRQGRWQIVSVKVWR